jgi:hypothetical protein
MKRRDFMALLGSATLAIQRVARAQPDEQRILWAAGDIVENRPPLSRWHPEYAEKVRRLPQGTLMAAYRPISIYRGTSVTRACS